MASAVDYDVIVVGAGVSGLYAAYSLINSHDRTALVLEAKDRIGGRTCAAHLQCAGGEDIWDFGGQWAGRTQHHLMSLLSELGLKVYDQFTTGEKKLMIHSSSNVKSYSGLIPNLGPLRLLELHRMMKKIESMCATINVDEISLHPNAVEWDSTTLHSFINHNCSYQETRELIETAVRIVLGVDLSQISLLYLLYYSKQAGSFEALLDAGKGGAQEYRVEGSMAQICDRLADKIKSGNIKCGHAVVSISQVESSHIEVTTTQGKKFKAYDVIIAIPPHLVNDIDFTPELPYDRVKLGEQMPVGHLIKFVATYRSSFWRDKGLSGETTVTGSPCSIGPITVTFDGTTSKGNPALIGFICADHALFWTRRSMTERREAVLQSLASMLGKECLNPIQYEDKDWAKELYNGGCPVSVMRPRGLLYFHHALRRPFGRVHWAGTECANVWCGYIEGAIASAKLAVAEVMEGSRPCEKVWSESPAFAHHPSFISDLDSNVWRSTVGSLKFAAVVGFLSYAGYVFYRLMAGMT